MTGVSLFLGYSLYNAQVKIAQLETELETRVTQNHQTIVTPDEELSWEVSNQDNTSILKIQGINKSERQPDEICVLSVVKNNQFYLNGNKKVDENSCQKPSLVIPDEDGIWGLEHTFSDQKSRTIRVEKIYKNNSTPKSYIDFTIGGK